MRAERERGAGRLSKKLGLKGWDPLISSRRACENGLMEQTSCAWEILSLQVTLGCLISYKKMLKLNQVLVSKVELTQIYLKEIQTIISNTKIMKNA